VNRTTISLPVELHYRARALAETRSISLAALIREALEEASGAGRVGMLGEPRAVYVAVTERPEGETAMKRMVISLPEELHERVRILGAANGVSMAALVRDLLDERTRRERPKPRFGAFTSGYSDTGRLAGEIVYEPRSWR
jgi:predicted DNA-binding protein